MNYTVAKNYKFITADSREVIPGTMFICKGKTFKREYLLSAIEKGAAAYVSEKDYKVNIPAYIVKDVLSAMAGLANAFYGNPWEDLQLIGITGTKGKSTVLYYLKNIIEKKGLPFGYLSTIDTFDGIEKFESHLTTPESLDLARHFDNAKKAGLKYFGMEASSQGFKYHRTDGVIFKIGAFLNFGPDHIGENEHTDIEDYFNAKTKIFSQCEKALINTDCERADMIAEAAKQCKQTVTFSAGRKADYTAANTGTQGGIHFDLIVRGKNLGEIRLCMPGLFNVENAVAAAAMAMELGFSFSDVKEGLSDAVAAGRMEVLEDKERQVKCIVDYAHNSLSFEKLFSSLREEYPDWQIQAFYGCPGGKGLRRRKELPEVSARLCDYTWITEEDPFMEDPAKISKEVYANLIKFGGKGRIIDDREEAVKTAIAEAKPKTIIVLTGKGREEYQHRATGYEKVESEYNMVKKYLGI